MRVNNHTNYDNHKTVRMNPPHVHARVAHICMYCICMHAHCVTTYMHECACMRGYFICVSALRMNPHPLPPLPTRNGPQNQSPPEIQSERHPDHESEISSEIFRESAPDHQSEIPAQSRGLPRFRPRFLPRSELTSMRGSLHPNSCTACELQVVSGAWCVVRSARVARGAW